MPIGLFVQIVCNGDTSLIQNWDTLFAEYIELSGDTSSFRNLSYMREISVLTNKIIIAETLVMQLTEGWNEGYINTLRTLGFRQQYTPDTLDNDLVSTINQCKSLVLTLKQRKHELSELTADNKPPTIADYDVYLSELSKFQGYRIETVAEYCAVAKRFKKQNKVR